MTLFNINKGEIESEISVDELLKKYDSPRRLNKMRPLYEQAATEVAEVVMPRLVYVEKPLSDLPDVVGHVAQETAVVLLAVCTLGVEIDERYESYLTHEMAMAAILDEISLAWIVQLTRIFHRKMRNLYFAQGLKVGPAYRPGVGNLPIKFQKLIFANAPTDHIGVTLNDSMMMIPIRSTSLFIPVYDRNK